LPKTGCIGFGATNRCSAAIEGESAVPEEGKLAIPVDRVRERLNGDPEWAIAARHWNARVRFYADDEEYFMALHDGRVVSFTAGTDGYQASTIHIGGPRSTWKRMVEALPAPLFQDFFPAAIHNGITLGGDLVSLYAYYGALSRFLVILRQEMSARPATSSES
jgi:hypothetical protein